LPRRAQTLPRRLLRATPQDGSTTREEEIQVIGESKWERELRERSIARAAERARLDAVHKKAAEDAKRQREEEGGMMNSRYESMGWHFQQLNQKLQLLEFQMRYADLAQSLRETFAVLQLKRGCRR
jgi:hypothetical protein